MLRYAATILLAAFLLFLGQPLIGKYILPWFGGGSGLWTACLLFFQCALLAGYLYAHLLTKWFTPAQQVIMHIVLLAGGLIFLPIVPREGFKPIDGTQPVLRIVILLAATIGVPYLALSSTGPLLQAWFARSYGGPARSPYRLYALSNVGSLLALLAYPFVMEPALTRSMQAYVWSGGFALFALLCAWCAIGQRGAVLSGASTNPARLPQPRHRGAAAIESMADSRKPTAFVRAMWVLLPMCASIMLLATTMQVSEEVAPMPFIWVAPLAAYLITFIIAFEWPRLYDRRMFVPLAIAAPWLHLFALIHTAGGIVFLSGTYALVLFTCCMICHGEVYRLRPAPARLTGYYLAIAFGGALGGAIVSIIAPAMFTFNVEIHLAIFGSLALLGLCMWHDAATPIFRGAIRLGGIAAMLTIALAGYLISRAVSAEHANAVVMTRSFYGSLVVRDMPDRSNVETRTRRLFHGRICHGSQSLVESERRTPLMYYTRESGVGMVMRLHKPRESRRIGVLGLGAGTLAAFGEAADLMCFYDINPQVEQIARAQFTYLSDCLAVTNVLQGDGRLVMERQQPQRYDILVLDVFSGDAVPTHLLTREAFAVYRRHLNADGVIAVNVSNRHLDLHPIVHALALDAGMSAAWVRTSAGEPGRTAAADWMIVTANRTLLAQPEIAAANALPAEPKPARSWTDEYSSVLDALRR